MNAPVALLHPPSCWQMAPSTVPPSPRKQSAEASGSHMPLLLPGLVVGGREVLQATDNQSCRWRVAAEAGPVPLSALGCWFQALLSLPPPTGVCRSAWTDPSPAPALAQPRRSPGRPQSPEVLLTLSIALGLVPKLPFAAGECPCVLGTASGSENGPVRWRASPLSRCVGVGTEPHGRSPDQGHTAKE